MRDIEQEESRIESKKTPSRSKKCDQERSEKCSSPFGRVLSARIQQIKESLKKMAKPRNDPPPMRLCLSSPNIVFPQSSIHKLFVKLVLDEKNSVSFDNDGLLKSLSECSRHEANEEGIFSNYYFVEEECEKCKFLEKQLFGLENVLLLKEEELKEYEKEIKRQSIEINTLHQNLQMNQPRQHQQYPTQERISQQDQIYQLPQPESISLTGPQTSIVNQNK
jgi:hypothetical protein